ncbi:peptidoglycan bridge formation glycyltransferase FemA/FemB family protein [candidate division KSB1 bacterium]|nr:peptidoglycan bridge formation glycyltransferase FemA/FemB family protein [candidate division KSB1 bacterium]
MNAFYISNNIRAEFNSISKSSWYDLLLHFDDASIYQTWAYGKIRWGDANLQHCVIKDDKEVIAIAQICIKKLKYINMGIAYIPWGPLWRKKGASLNIDNLKFIFRALIKEYTLNRKLNLRIRPNEFESENNQVMNTILDMGFKKNKNSKAYRTIIVDITPSIEEIRKNLNQKWRNQLKKAEKNGIEVSKGTSNEMYKSFLCIQKEMQNRKKYKPGVSYSEFQKIQNELPEKHKMKIMLGKYKNETICALISSSLGNTGIYLLGATSNSGLKYNGSNLLQWEMIKYLKENNIYFYDLGGINPEKNPGVYNFKKRLAGKKGRDIQHIGTYNYYSNKLNEIFLYFVNKLYSK